MEDTIKTSDYQYLRCFETHSKMEVGDLVIRGVEDVELLIRISALNSRGVFIPDSDLNNNEILHKVIAQSDRTTNAFIRGIETGFVRRMVRMDDITGAPQSQQKLHSDLRKSDPERASKIDEAHPPRLDRLFGEAEKKYPPVTWELKQVAAIFAKRLQDTMREISGDPEQPAEVRDLADTLFDYVDTHKASQYQTLRGAKIVADFLKDWATNKAQALIYQGLLDSYNTNMICIFKESPIVTSHNGKLPPGLVLSPGANDQVRQAQFKMMSKSGSYEVLYQPDERLTIPSFSINRRWLEDIVLDRVIEMRESAPFQNFYDAVYQSLQSPEKLVQTQSALLNNTVQYWDTVFQGLKRIGTVGDIHVSVGHLGICTVELDIDRAATPLTGAAFVPNCGALVTLPIYSLHNYFDAGPLADSRLVPVDSLFKYACFIPAALKSPAEQATHND